MTPIRLVSLLAGLLIAAAPIPASADPYESIRETLEECTACHGQKGASYLDEFPILGGQEFYYLYVQLKDFKSGRRASDIMKDIVADFDKTKMKLLATYFSKQSWPNINYISDPALAQKGEVSSAAGQCVQCHLGGYEGNSRIPRLAGQHKKYLLKTMMDFKHKRRLNSPAKSSLMVSFKDESIEAMADYLAGK